MFGKCLRAFSGKPAFAIISERDGKFLRAGCVLLAAGLVFLAAQGGMVSMYLIPRSDLFCVRVIDGGQWFTISNEEDGLYVTWESMHDCPFCPFRIIWGQKWGQDPTPHAASAWPEHVYYTEGTGWPFEYHRLYVPRLPVAGLLVLWPVLHWVRANHRKKLASAPGFSVGKSPGTQ